MSISVNKNVLVLGGVIIDHYIMAEFPRRGEDTLITREFQQVASCALNVAVTLKNLGCNPYLVSSVGADPRGQRIMAYLEEREIDPRFIALHTEPQASPSGYCLVLVEPGGERTFVTYRGCEDSLPTELLDEMGDDIHFPYIYPSGYYLLNPEESGVKIRLLAELKRRGSKILFDPGSLAHHIDGKTLESVLDLAEIALPNRREIALLDEKLNQSFRSWCLARNYSLIVEKDGSNPFYSYTKDRVSRHIPAAVKAVDTTGAGDSFAAGLIFGLLQAKAPQAEAMQIASACGALATTFVEPHGNFSAEELQQFMHTRR